jgi:abortive infection bacteriophage resistance protein
MVHHRVKYGDPVPVRIAVEFLDFGALCRLYRLLEKSDQNVIAAHMGVKGGALLRRWLRDLNYLRNVCAHHSRLWNRVLTYQSGKFNRNQVDADLQHAADWAVRDKVYVLAAILSYLVRHIDPASTWHLDFRTHVRKFPDVPDKSPEADMGFPERVGRVAALEHGAQQLGVPWAHSGHTWAQTRGNPRELQVMLIRR